ncbi:tail completion protein [Yersinia frederiksenii]|nr:tail completion protein [Yersinia frederiksenii]CNI34050.1 tail completion protein [Yersinia frederiksenii]
MDNEFQELEQYLQRLINRGKSGARHKLSREISITLRRGQQQRIRQQLNANGSPYTKRKDSIKTVQKRLRFIYQGTVRDLKNWSGNKRQITGWDNDRNAIRTFNRVDIDRSRRKPPPSAPVKKNRCFAAYTMPHSYAFRHSPILPVPVIPVSRLKLPKYTNTAAPTR